jgi:uncharacterized membrane protein
MLFHEAMSYWLTFAAALGSALIGGVFYAFSTFVMRALGRIAPSNGIAAMQSINVVVINPLFLGVFLGMAALSSVFLVLPLFQGIGPGTGWRQAGSALYFFGCFGVTLAFNVPRNDALAAVKPDSAEGAKVWERYLREWTFWNHVRTVASLAGAACFILALV